ncbi:MAG: serine hydrolase [Chloroflexota bacterium]
MSKSTSSFYRPKRFRFNAAWTIIKQLAGLALLGLCLWFLGGEIWEYLKVRDNFPKGTTIGGVDVGALGVDDSKTLVLGEYSKPVIAIHEQRAVEISPADSGFTIQIDQMLNEATQTLQSTPHWERFIGNFSTKYFPQDIQPELGKIEVPLYASVDDAMLETVMGYLGNLIDQPATAPVLLTESGGAIEEGRPGFTIDKAVSKERISAAMFRPYDRTVELAIEEQAAPTLDISYLENYLSQQLEIFDGIGSLYILDLQTGEEISINANDAISGLSVVKIAIMLEALRVTEGTPGFDMIKLLEETAIYSGNYSANLLLDIVAGENNAYLGVDVLTNSMKNLGLPNTFIVTPYEEPPRAAKPTLITDANANPTIDFDPDPAMQTTAAEIGRLLGMIYDCSKGGGTLIAVYPDQMTPEKCETLIQLMARNDEGNLIRFGVPENVTVAHKHGWAFNTHGDAGIVLSPGGDYVISQYLYQNTDWLPSSVTFPILRELSRTVYNFYNSDETYTDHKRAQKAAGVYAAGFAIDQAEERYQNGVSE